MANATTTAQFSVTVNGITLTAKATLHTRGTSFPNSNNSMLHNRFTVTVRSSNGGRTAFAFYDSVANYKTALLSYLKIA